MHTLLKAYQIRLYTLWCERGGAYLPAQVVDDFLVFAVVSDDGALVLVPLTDLELQLGIGGLQGAHLVQVCGQPVVEVLHGVLLLARYGYGAARSCESEVEAGARAEAGAGTAAEAGAKTGGVGHVDVLGPEGQGRSPPGARVGRGGVQRAGILLAEGHGDLTGMRPTVSLCRSLVRDARAMRRGDGAEAAAEDGFYSVLSPEVGAAPTGKAASAAITGVARAWRLGIQVCLLIWTQRLSARYSTRGVFGVCANAYPPSPLPLP